MVGTMNKIEVELTEALIKIEHDAAKIAAYHGSGGLVQALTKDLADFKVILFKLLAEENE